MMKVIFLLSILGSLIILLTVSWFSKCRSKMSCDCCEGAVYVIEFDCHDVDILSAHLPHLAYAVEQYEILLQANFLDSVNDCM